MIRELLKAYRGTREAKDWREELFSRLEKKEFQMLLVIPSEADRVSP